MKAIFGLFAATIMCLPVLAQTHTGTEMLPAFQHDAKLEIVKEFGALLDSSNMQGVILVYDATNNTLFTNDIEMSKQGHLPASTFKIANSVIGLESGVVDSDTSIFRWDGSPRRLSSWEKDLRLREAFQVSCVPCYQQLARKIGYSRMHDWLNRLNYGHMVFDSAQIDVFWLEGESRISPMEQIDFLQRLHDGKLPVSDKTTQVMKRLMLIETHGQWQLSGKTGWAIRNGNNTGWFVGYLENKSGVYYFAVLVQPDTAFNMELFPIIRKSITMKALAQLKLLDE